MLIKLFCWSTRAICVNEFSFCWSQFSNGLVSCETVIHTAQNMDRLPAVSLFFLVHRTSNYAWHWRTEEKRETACSLNIKGVLRKLKGDKKEKEDGKGTCSLFLPAPLHPSVLCLPLLHYAGQVSLGNGLVKMLSCVVSST